MVKIYGNWCGPNWTGGKHLSAEEYKNRGYDWSAPCNDPLDCACRTHDKACSGSKGCSRRADTALIQAAEKRIIPPWLLPFNSKARIKESMNAQLVRDAMLIARLTRRH